MGFFDPTKVLISPTHRSQYVEHYSTREEQLRPHAWQGKVETIAGKLGVDTVLDYGCGPAKALQHFSKLNVTSYDPALPKANPHGLLPFDMVVCNHTLEHVEIEHLDAVLEHIKGLTKKAAYIAVSLQPSTKKLPNGTPWHTIVQDAAWWRNRLGQHFPHFEELATSAPSKELVILWTP